MNKMSFYKKITSQKDKSNEENIKKFFHTIVEDYYVAEFCYLLLESVNELTGETVNIRSILKNSEKNNNVYFLRISLESKLEKLNILNKKFGKMNTKFGKFQCKFIDKKTFITVKITEEITDGKK